MFGVNEPYISGKELKYLKLGKVTPLTFPEAFHFHKKVLKPSKSGNLAIFQIWGIFSSLNRDLTVFLEKNA